MVHGLGVGKTMKRNEGPFKPYAIDLLDPSTLMDSEEVLERTTIVV
jgi:hypothetical protein